VPIATWILTPPVPVGPGQWAVAYQLREVLLRFPADAPAGGSLVIACLGDDGREIGDRILHAFTPEDLGRLTDAVHEHVDAAETLLLAKQYLRRGSFTRELREHAAPVPHALPPPDPGMGGLK
jgi:hypothetical protein